MTALSSETVAKELGVRHYDLMRSVKKAEKYQRSMNDDHRSLEINFNPVFKDWEYKDSRGRTRKCKIMNADGVKALIKVIDTQEAYNYFAWIMSKFNDMREERHIRQITKRIRKALTDTISDFCQYAEETRGKNYKEGKCPYYKHFTDLVYKTLGITKPPKGSDRREILTAREVSDIEQMEAEISWMIQDLMEEGVDYHDIYKKIKADLRGELRL